ncbi:MAG: hypothetical protein KAY32_17150 [Candidatus Eisenbacteria sp.]|nr:hypothetical protein [Candidatus Eisenbacteria bacterium]
MRHASMQEAARITEALLVMPTGSETAMNGRRVRRDAADGLETWVVDGRRHGYFLAVEAVTGRTTEELAAWIRRVRR